MTRRNGTMVSPIVAILTITLLGLTPRPGTATSPYPPDILDKVVGFELIMQPFLDGVGYSQVIVTTGNHPDKEAVQKSLSSSEHTLRYMHVNFPAFSAYVTIEGFEKLIADSRVRTIEPVRRAKFLTGVAFPHIEGAGWARMMHTGRYQEMGESGGAGVLEAAVTIGLVDSGIDSDHWDLMDNKVWLDVWFDNTDTATDLVGHGTSVAGIAAGHIPGRATPWMGPAFRQLMGNNPNYWNSNDQPRELATVNYVGGVAHNAYLANFKVGDDEPDMALVLFAWDRAITYQFDIPTRPIMILNVSIGGGQFFDICDDQAPAFAMAARACAQRDILIVAASGNDYYTDSMVMPACLSNVLSVGAVWNHSAFGQDSAGAGKDEVTNYTNSAPFLDVLAPGDPISTLYLWTEEPDQTTQVVDKMKDNYTAMFQGTSAAAPFVSGLAAVLQASYRRKYGEFMTVPQLRRVLRDSGTPIRDWRPPRRIKPRVNIGAALDMALHNYEDLTPGSRHQMVQAPPVANMVADGYEPYGANDFGAGVAYAMGYAYKAFQEAYQNQNLHVIPRVTPYPVFIDPEDPPDAPDWRVPVVPIPQPVVPAKSPHFAMQSGGGGFFPFSGSLFEGHGLERLANLPDFSTPVTETHYNSALNHRNLGYRAMFRPHNVNINERGLFASRYNNNIRLMKEHIRRGDSFVIGLPVFEDFVNHNYGMYTHTKMDANNRLLGYHSVNVIGYDEKMVQMVGTTPVRGAFLIVNSWGTNWGTTAMDPFDETPAADRRGYAWVSEDFIRRYAIQAYAMTEDIAARTWLLTNFVFNYNPTLRQGNFYAISKDYTIEYSTRSREFPYWIDPANFFILDGEGAATQKVIQIVNGDENDVLTIRKRPGVGPATPIDRVVNSEGAFSRLYTEVDIHTVECGQGTLNRVVAQDAHITNLSAWQLQDIRMTRRNDYTWSDLSRHVAGQPAPDASLNALRNEVFTSIRETQPVNPHRAEPYTHVVNVQLSGVNLRSVVAPNARVRLTVHSKKYAETGKFPYLSAAGVQGPSAPGAPAQDFLIHVNELPRLQVVGGDISNGVIRTQYGMGQIIARPQGLSSALQYYRNINHPEIPLRPKFADMYGGGIDNVSFYAENGNIDAILALGGHLNASGAPATIAAQGNINLVASNTLVYRRVRGAARERIIQGGLLGSPNDPTALRIAAGAFGQIDPRLANIRALRGDLVVSGQFMAGSDHPTYQNGNWLGRVGRIVTRNAGQMPRNVYPPIPLDFPFIAGQSWSNRPIAFPSNANRALFFEN